MKNRIRGLAGGLLVALAAPGAPRLPATDPGAAPDTAAPLAAADAEAATAPAPLSIQVDLSDRRLYVLDRGRVIQTHRVAVSHPIWPTPEGEFRIRRIAWSPGWFRPDLRCAWRARAREPRSPTGHVKIFFREPSYYIQGTRESYPVRRVELHGRIRMRSSEAVRLARLIMQRGGASRPQSWWRRALNRVRNTQEVHLSRSVPVIIQR